MFFYIKRRVRIYPLKQLIGKCLLTNFDFQIGRSWSLGWIRLPYVPGKWSSLTAFKYKIKAEIKEETKPPFVLLDSIENEPYKIYCLRQSCTPIINRFVYGSCSVLYQSHRFHFLCSCVFFDIHDIGSYVGHLTFAFIQSLPFHA